MNEGETYPNAPVVLVALEVRHPAGAPLSAAQQREVKRQLAHVAPIARQGEVTNIEGVIGAADGSSVNVEKFPRFFSRDSTLCASFREGSTVVETTRYKGWYQMLGFLKEVLRARGNMGVPDGFERVGLRYVNELRVPEQNNTNWAHWLDSSLLGPAEVGGKLGLQPGQWQGISLFTPPGSNRTVVLRYGSREGYAVNPGGDLKRPAPTPGPFFLLDIDSFWESGDVVPEFDVDQLVAISDELHAPVRKLFEGLITNELRDEVLRHAN
jgi:uncharacterized protein (TIGR04255 family)